MTFFIPNIYSYRFFVVEQKILFQIINSSKVPCLTSWPLSSLKMISQFLSVFKRWAIKMMVISLLRLLTESITTFSVLLSNALVASSKISNFGLWYKALAIPIRWRCPPYNLTPRSPVIVWYFLGNSSITKLCKFAILQAFSTASWSIFLVSIPKAMLAVIVSSDK